jgi:signal transduction histidine kinase
MKDMFKNFMISILICLFAFGSVYAAEKGTPEEAKKLVEQAVAFVKANGQEKALKEFNKPKGKFVKGEMYVFAYDLNAVMVAHPVNPKLIGKNLINEPDSKGKLFRKEIVELAKANGSGLVDYTYLNPATKQEEPKTTYIQKMGDLIICCGAYK